jgi:hypothetical protein
MVSIRNTCEKTPIYVTKANHYDSQGTLIRSYLEGPVSLKSLETVDIMIHVDDTSDGTSGNFIFEWSLPKDGNKPLIQVVMTSTLGQQGLSFTADAVEMNLH